MQNPLNKIVTRFAPSPTGFLHIGGVRTALYNYLYAKKNNGKFILRIEDTDKKRNTKEAEQAIIDSMAWLGLDYDEIYRQSDRTNIYRKYLEDLVTKGMAYVSEEESKQDPGKMISVIRFKNPGEIVTFKDNVCGQVSVDTTDLGDFVIAKNFDEPIFHFSNVVDDFEMGVTHIMRGQEHLANTPRQILIARAIGAPDFNYTHIPLVLAPDKTKLSKRHGAISSMEYKNMGYLPEAILNFMALIGWNPGTEQEIFNLNELVDAFSIEKINKSSGVFNIQKLNWVNKEHIKKLNQAEQFLFVQSFLPSDVKSLENYNLEMLEKVLHLIIERIETFGDVSVLAKQGEFTYFFEKPVYKKEELFFSKTKFEGGNRHEDLSAIIQETIKRLKEVNDWNPENIKKSVWDYSEMVGRGDVLWPMRFALSGREKSPDPFSLAYVLGKNETLQRLHNAKELLLQI